MNSSNRQKEISRIEKRAIEARAVPPVIRALAEKGRNGIEELAEDVATWGEGGG